MMGKQLKTARMKMGLTQVEMADFLCCHPQTISEMERDTKPISKLVEKVIAQYNHILALETQVLQKKLLNLSNAG